jgi:NADH-quinone oxidoreductase subunit L
MKAGVLADLAGFALATLLYLWKPELAGKARNSVRRRWCGSWRRSTAGQAVDRRLRRRRREAGQAVARLDRQHVIDGVIVNGSARVVDLAASLLRKTQSGYLYHYAFAMIIGLIACWPCSCVSGGAAP